MNTTTTTATTTAITTTIKETRIGRVVLKTVKVDGVLIGGTISTLCGGDLDSYVPNFKPVITGSGECWVKTAGYKWCVPTQLSDSYSRTEFGGGLASTSPSTPTASSEQEALNLLLPKFLNGRGTWMKSFLKKGGNLLEGSWESHIKIVVEQVEAVDIDLW